MTAAYFAAAVRTPMGRAGGQLAAVRPDDLASAAISALLARTPALDVAQVDEVLWGAANQAGEDNRNVARMALLLAGLPVEVPGATLNRLCGSVSRPWRRRRGWWPSARRTSSSPVGRRA